jgi:hypothetical protein
VGATRTQDRCFRGLAGESTEKSKLEKQMHDIDSTQAESGNDLEAFESERFEFEEEGEMEFEGESSFSEFEESELAEELLGVESEEELEQFLGKLVKKAWRGARKFARSRVGKALGGALKRIAKKVLPIAGGALGSFIPIPGVGTMVGTAAGRAVGNLFEMELEGMDEQEQEFEVAKRFVRLAGVSAAQAAKAPPHVNPRVVAQKAVAKAAQRIAPTISGSLGSSSNGFHPSTRARSGRWERRGRTVVLFGA